MYWFHSGQNDEAKSFRQVRESDNVGQPTSRWQVARLLPDREEELLRMIIELTRSLRERQSTRDGPLAAFESTGRIDLIVDRVP
ncbi:MAG: hypothetical protein O3B13_19880 [Planctomycetota bacterium]|nr:hypothetical protein [Planctomycetota bacterium]MDA1165365.1 hypothetical protein [Planctomycetota bacterium]